MGLRLRVVAHSLRPAAAGWRRYPSPLARAQAAAVEDLHQWTADVPEVLVEAIGDCLQKDPRRRPKSMAELAQRLGPPRRHGRQAIARCLLAAARPRRLWLRSKRSPGKKASHPHRFTAAALAVLAAVAVAWPIWVAHNGSREQGAGGAPAQRVGEPAGHPRAGRGAGSGEQRHASRLRRTRRRENLLVLVAFRVMKSITRSVMSTILLDRCSTGRSLRPAIPPRLASQLPDPLRGCPACSLLSKFACPPTGRSAASCCRSRRDNGSGPKADGRGSSFRRKGSRSRPIGSRSKTLTSWPKGLQTGPRSAMGALGR